jgi:hypothetical protein
MVKVAGLLQEQNIHKFTADHFYQIDKNGDKIILDAKKLSSAFKSTGNPTMLKTIDNMEKYMDSLKEDISALKS